MFYCKRKKHPKSHVFNPANGRVLKEYQLESQSCKRQRVYSGTMILLFPNEWHTYEPDKDSGKLEYWIDFRGMHIDKRIEYDFIWTAR